MKNKTLPPPSFAKYYLKITSNHRYKLLVWLCCVLCVQYAQAQEKYMFQPIGHNEPIPIGVKKRWGWDTDTSGRWCEPITPANLLTTYKGLIPLGKHDSLALEGEFIPFKGGSRYIYNHFYKGIPVHYGDFTVTTWNGKVTRITDFLIRDLDIDTTKVLITKSDMKRMALDSAKAHKLGEYKILGLSAGIYETFGLIYRYSLLELNPRPLKIWELEVYPFAKEAYFHEKITGLEADICLSSCVIPWGTPIDNCGLGNSTIYTNADVAGCSFTNGTATFPIHGMKGDLANTCVTEDIDYCSTEKMFRVSRSALPLISANFCNPPTQFPVVLGQPVYFKQGTVLAPYNFKGDVLAAVNAYWGIGNALDYWQSWGVNSYNGTGAPIQIVVKSSFASNAQWKFENESGLPVKNQIHITESSQNVAYSKQEIMSHEFTHGVLANKFFIDKMLRLGDAGGYNTFETLALHEGLSDVFAILTDRHLDAANGNSDGTWWNWVFGTTTGRRVLQDPDQSDITIGGDIYHQAKTYQGAYWNTHLGVFTPAASDVIIPLPQGKQYIAAGVPTYWFYLLSEGGSSTNDANQPFNVIGIGIDKAENILHKGLAIMSPDSATANHHAQFGGLRNATIKAAQIEYGNCSDEMTQTILAWQAVGVGRSTPDLVARDGIYDKGLQPNLYWAKYHATTGVRVGGDLWESPDVWNRNAVISNPSTAPDIHEPPSQVAAGTQQNTFLSRLFNYSSCTSPAGTIQQYWTIASTGEMWPNDWINDTHGNCQVSRELNPIQVSAGAVPMGGSTTFGQVWTPPSPADLYACGVPPIDTQNGARYELCMLSRFVSATDTMYAKETADIAKNVIENNNVVTRNTFIAEVSGVTGISPIKYLMIKNNNQFSASLNIVLSGLSGTQQSTPLYVDFVLSPTLWQRWVNSGMQCQGVTVLAPRVLRATNLGLANISNIPFNSLESLPLGVQVTMPIATIGKVVSPYVFTIHHESSDARVKLLPSSVCKFETQVSKKTASEEVSTPILSEVYAAPNPMRTGTRVVFDVAMEGTVSIELFGVNGELVQSLGMGRLAAGRHTAHITLPDGAAAGVYFCRVATPSYTRTIRILKL